MLCLHVYILSLISILICVYIPFHQSKQSESARASLAELTNDLRADLEKVKAENTSLQEEVKVATEQVCTDVVCLCLAVLVLELSHEFAYTHADSSA